jgi:hypothetical protein
LVSLNARYLGANAADREPLLAMLLTRAAARQQFLASLIKDNPSEVLRITIPASIRASLPPVVQNYVEEEVEVEGTLKVLYEDSVTTSRLRHFLEVNGEWFSLHFATRRPQLLSGTVVRVSGIHIDGALALASGETSVEVMELNPNNSTGGTGTTPSPTLPNTFGEQRTVVLLVNFQDNPIEPYTLDYARSVVFATTNNFNLENSFGQTWLTGDVYGWFTIPLSSTVCDYPTLATYAQQAATEAGANLSAYNRYIYAFPTNACNWMGLGTVGGNPSQAWIKGDFDLQVVAHELGHNFGLMHSNAWECGTTTLGDSCTHLEYGDVVDTMGTLLSGHFNAFQKERLGWLNSGVLPPITTVQTDGIYTLDPYASAGAHPKALKILKSIDATTDKKTWFYVEVRRPLGYDSFVSRYSNLLSGVIVHTGSEATGNSSYLLDMTPTTSSWFDPALPVGQTFLDLDSGVTIAPLSVGDTGAVVSVSFVSSLGVSVASTQASYTRNQTVSITTTVWNGGAPVANASVTFTLTKADGSAITSTATTGTNGVAMFSYRLKKQDPVGTYRAQGVANLNGLSGSAGTSFMVQ